MRATAQALFMVGVLVGSKVFGILSDVYGRKFSFFLSVVLQEGSRCQRDESFCPKIYQKVHTIGELLVRVR
jgi:MFS family permease